MEFPKAITDTAWSTIMSHPHSNTQYQEIDLGYTWARVIVKGREVLSPTIDTDRAYRVYQGRVERAIEGSTSH